MLPFLLCENYVLAFEAEILKMFIGTFNLDPKVRRSYEKSVYRNGSFHYYELLACTLANL